MGDSVNRISKDTRLCISLSGRPSNIGTRFHNFLYAELGLDFVYKAMTTDDIEAAVGGIRALGIRGAGISMPFKEDCLALVDVVKDSAAAIGAVNTIVNTNGRLAAYNTDFQAVELLLRQKQIDPAMSFAVVGSGGMAKAVVAALRDHGMTNGTVVARNETNGRALAQQYGFRWRQDVLGDVDLLVNATPIGMDGGNEGRLPFAEERIAAASAVLDVVATPEVTPFLAAAAERGLVTITGAEIIALQAAEQFALYTGVRPTPEQVARASAYSRAP
ncbi:shikimate 5-dehydrogenase [Cumulibacter manganitolerans]|uniref:shikimate 5-dehydrogenase n=1 Tax=Cumulibacter manganitolerans TaxID=1884992 RepID=UPI00129777F2|nr:shikimate 5-dehydrogenase [Cumulibacter manganitolerans]